MTIQIEKETSTELEFDYDALIRKVILAALEYEQCPYEAEINVILTDNASIQQVNAEIRGIDLATDVLSFPMAEYPSPAEFEGLEEQEDCFHPETGELLLGDIMISLDKVLSQSAEYGHSSERELGFLVAHSMLHLFGYDHMEEEERITMEERQEKILESIGLFR